MNRPSDRSAFTLVELLTAIAVIGLLVGLLLPALSRATMLARVARAHTELRQITLALSMYRDENEGRLPPTRFSCSTRAAYELPVELLHLLPGGHKGGVNFVDFPDPFHSGENYKYRAVGAAILNEFTLLPNAASLWIPDGFPDEEAGTGRYVTNPSDSPVRYAVYSLGPSPRSSKFDAPGRLPLPRRYWLGGAMDAGVIVHFEDFKRRIRTSP